MQNRNSRLYYDSVSSCCVRGETGVICSGGGIGRRVWLRSIWSNPWGFKSPPEYHKESMAQDAYIAQSVEHILGKDEVSGSSPDVGSI